jgi:uncharacterized membrane protein
VGAWVAVDFAAVEAVLAAAGPRDVGDMNIKRCLRHLMLPRWFAVRRFPSAAMARIERAVKESEMLHGGQVRVAVESSLDIGALMRKQTARERALDVFSELRVWDTRDNCGVLLYLLLADHDVEIVADRGIAERVSQSQWENICQEMEIEFRAGHFETGLLRGVKRVSALLALHFPASGERNDKLPDRPTLL